MDAFTGWHDGLKTSEIDNHIGTLEAPNGAANNFPGTILELVIDHFLLGLADALHHRLFGGLRGNTPEVFWGYLHVDHVADDDLRFDGASLAQRNLIVVVGHGFHDDQTGHGTDLPRLAIDVDAQFACGSNGCLGRGEQGILHGLHEDLAPNTLLTFKIIQP